MHATLLLLVALGQIPAQNVKPQIGYVYPPGGRAGSTVEVRIGGYDWTPDMQVLVHDERVKLEIIGPAGEPILTPPPYWFGQKAGQSQPPLPREVPARITIPADMPPGVVNWQVANANGGSNVGTFVVSDVEEVIEPKNTRGQTLELPALPICVSGRLSRITEVDEYRFTVARDGLVTCRLDDRLGQPFSGQVTIRDAAGNVVADEADTAGQGCDVVFLAIKGGAYTVSVHDVEFAGDRGFVYRLALAQGPRVVASLPLVLRRGATQPVEFIGWGVATGALKLESVTQQVAVLADAQDSFLFAFDTPAGRASHPFAIADEGDTVEPAVSDLGKRSLPIPSQTSGALEQVDPATAMATDRYQIEGKKGTTLRIAVEAKQFGSPVDPLLTVIAADGKELARNDDVANTTVDAAIEFKPPADGSYEVRVSDVSGTPPSRASVYRLTIEDVAEAFDFTLQLPDRGDVPLGEKADLAIKVEKRGAWKAPITLQLEGLPAGVLIESELVILADKNELKLPLSAASDAAAAAALVRLTATATVGERTIVKRSDPILVTSTLKARCKVKSAVQDGGRIVNRGTTYPAELIIERLEDFSGPITLQMGAIQQRQRRGIRGGEMLVAPGNDRAFYPVFMPEWLETSLTARINVIGVAQVADPKGNVRHVTGAMDGLVVMSLEGALLKISHEPQERTIAPGGRIEIPVRIARSARLPETVKVELVADEATAGLITAEAQTLPPDVSDAVVKLTIAEDAQLANETWVTIRATALQAGKWPVVSETRVSLLRAAVTITTAAK